jgi:hypothetical protein
MMYRGVEYSVSRTDEPGIWKWRFFIGGAVKTGKTGTNLELLAMRRARMRIDAALRKGEVA